MSTNEIAVRGKSKLRTALRISMIALVVIIGIAVSVTILNKPYDRTDATFTNIEIVKGDTTSTVADKLEEAGVIRSASSFRFYCKLMRYNGKFKVGRYYLSPSMNTNVIADTMVNGITTSNGFTIPGGYTVDQLADALAQAGFVNKNKFINAASETDFSDFYFIDSETNGIDKVEGFLMPGTYEIVENVDETMMITILLNEFDSFFTEEYRARCDELGMSVRDIVIIASMIEKETTIDKERSTISSVIHNRINMEMELDGGFPRAPLCSPSKESIIAALYPDDTDYLYCVHNSELDGSHLFTSDINEYEELKASYEDALKERDKKKE